VQRSLVKVLHVVGARPNFMKIAPVIRAVEAWNASADTSGTQFEQVLVHTGQHYDRALSTVFFEQLGLPEPDEYLGVGSGTQADQTARLMSALEPVVERHEPNLVVVPGDVNSTLAAALVAAKLGVPVAHLEAGLRSGDRTMPEEINRIVTDHLSDVLLTTCVDADVNLAREGLSSRHVRRVGNTMIDTLVRLRPKAEEAFERTRVAVGLPDADFALVTLHRPSNVDDPNQLARLMRVLAKVAREVPVVFPVHLRTRRQLAGLDVESSSGLTLSEPLGYLEFLGLMAQAAVVITDSGGIQEETSFLGVPCVTVRSCTERPVTVVDGTNVLVDPSDESAILSAVRGAIARGLSSPPPAIGLWDGAAGGRVVEAFVEWAQGA